MLSRIAEVGKKKNKPHKDESISQTLNTNANRTMSLIRPFCLWYWIIISINDFIQIFDYYFCDLKYNHVLYVKKAHNKSRTQLKSIPLHIISFPFLFIHTSRSILKSNVFSGVTKRLRAIDAKLHTAISSRDEYRTTSVHKLEHFIVPKFCWLVFRLHVSCNFKLI